MTLRDKLFFFGCLAFLVISLSLGVFVGPAAQDVALIGFFLYFGWAEVVLTVRQKRRQGWKI